MASLTERLAGLSKSPAARKVAEKAREIATKPENRQKVADLMSRFSGKPKAR